MAASRRKRRRQTPSHQQFFQVPYVMAQSDAMRSLSGPALKIWVELRTRYSGFNNGEVRLSYEEAARLLGLSKSTVKRGFDELVEKGFIRLSRPGQWFGRRAALWVLTDVSHRDEAPTRDWRRWRPGQPVATADVESKILGILDEHHDTATVP